MICRPDLLVAFILGRNVVVFALLALMPRSLRGATLFAIVAIFILIAISLPPVALMGYIFFAPLELLAYVLAAKRKIKLGVVVLIASALLEAYEIMKTCSTIH